MASKPLEAKPGRSSIETSKPEGKVVTGGSEARKDGRNGKKFGTDSHTNGLRVDKQRCELNNSEEKNEEMKSENKSAIKHSKGQRTGIVGQQRGRGEGGMVKSVSGPSTKGKGKTDAKVLKQTLITGDNELLDVGDYLTLLKILNIKLPKGVLNPSVIKLSTNPSIIRDAKAIVEDLERFKLEFIARPRLACREVKRALDLKNSRNALEITRIIFFEKMKDNKDRKENITARWKKNVSNTGHGFRMKDKYTKTPISTPAMYNTATTRSWIRTEGAGEVRAEVTQGTRVNVQELEKMNFSDESEEICRQKKNSLNEKECLKFLHELREIAAENENVRYTKGNKVEFGFLSGNLDFLAVITHNADSVKNESSTEKVIIECKGTNGNMVGKLFTKPSQGHRAQFIDSHEYCFQTQAYAYILRQSQPSLTPARTVMVVRHYHSDGSRSGDFYWNYLKNDHSKQIDELKDFCQEEVLARFLAVLGIIFQKES